MKRAGFGVGTGVWSWLLLAMAAAGCGGAGVTLGDVEGVVMLDGQPLANATVEFVPDTSVKNVRPSVGETGPDGKYKLRFTRERTGAVVGKHKILITTFSPTGDGKFKERVPAIYNTASTLVREVQPQANWLDFDLRTSTGESQALAAGE